MSASLTTVLAGPGAHDAATARSEVLKLRTSAPVQVGAGVAVLFVAVLALLYAVFSREVPGGLGEPAVLRNVYLAGYRYGSLAAVLLGIAMVAGEARQGILLPAVLSSGSRVRLLAVKAVVAAGAGLAVGAALVAASVLVGAVAAVANGEPTLLGEPETWGALVRCLLAFAAWTWLGLGLGALTGRDLLAVIIALVWLFVVEGTVQLVVGATSLAGVVAYLPQSLSMALAGGQPTGAVLDDPWLACLLLLLYGAVLVAVGAVAFHRRDLRG